MEYYRISKYDSRHRTDGIYQKNEWTSMSDIGKTFDGKLFTESEYSEVEKMYIDFVLNVCNVQNITFLTVKDIEGQNKFLLHNGQTLDLCQSKEFIRECLRENCWGRLFSEEFVFETGYDYYIHIGCSFSFEEIQQIAKEYNLYAEKWIPANL